MINLYVSQGHKYIYLGWGFTLCSPCLILLKSSSTTSKKTYSTTHVTHVSRKCKGYAHAYKACKHCAYVYVRLCQYMLILSNTQLHSARLHYYGSCMCMDTPVKGSLRFTEINGMNWSILSMRTPSVMNIPSFPKCQVVKWMWKIMKNIFGQISFLKQYK